MKFSTSVMILFAVAGGAVAATAPSTGPQVQAPDTGAPTPATSGATGSGSDGAHPHKPHRHHGHDHHGRHVSLYGKISSMYQEIVGIEEMFHKLGLSAHSSGHHKGLQGGALSAPTSPSTGAPPADQKTKAKAKVGKSKHHEKIPKELKKDLRDIMHALKHLEKEAKHLRKLVHHKKLVKSRAGHLHSKGRKHRLHKRPPTENSPADAPSANLQSSTGAPNAPASQFAVPVPNSPPLQAAAGTMAGGGRLP